MRTVTLSLTNPFPWPTSPKAARPAARHAPRPAVRLQELGAMSLRLLRDINAPDWLQRRSLESTESDRYEQIKAKLPLHHFL